MTNIEKHAPGAFCWVELATTDQPAAIDFYSRVFGWSANNMPMGPTLFMPPTDFEDVGRISIIADPQGAAFAIFKAAARGASAP